jgi:hypothetical protein
MEQQKNISFWPRRQTFGHHNDQTSYESTRSPNGSKTAAANTLSAAGLQPVRLLGLPHRVGHLGAARTYRGAAGRRAVLLGLMFNFGI